MKSVETSKTDPALVDVYGNEKIETAQPVSKAYGAGMVALTSISCLGFCGIIVAYFVFVHLLDSGLSDATRICDSNSQAIQIMEDVPEQLVQTWMFNLTNPHEYLAGGDARLNEMGVYGWRFTPQLENIEINTDTMEFDLYNHDVQFSADDSCDTCATTETMFHQFTPYGALVGMAKSEAVVMLSIACSPTQIGLIASTDPFPYCEEDEMKTATLCRCCAPTPTVNATTCSDIASTSSKSGGLLSWLSKYDGGIQLSESPNSNFPLSTGDYTALVRQGSVKELALGHPSTIVGFFRMGKALLEGDLTTINEYAKTTNDMKDACTPLGYCPTMNELLQQIMLNPTPQNMLAVLQSVDCSGLIPSADVLENTYGLDHERTLELRYLEGVNCRPYGLTLAISTAIQAQSISAGATHTCADASHSLPCCMSAFSAPSLGGDGSAVGCLGWSNGMVQTRNLFSVEEAQKYILPAPHAKSFTVCAEESIRFQQEMWHGMDEWNSWFTPDSYVYPNMNWADPSMVTGAAAGTVAGSYYEYDIEGTQMALRKGRGITTGFLEYDLTDGEPINKQESVWAPFRLSALDFNYQESFTYQDLKVAYMLPEIQTEFTDAEIEARQRQGEMPYPNQRNVAYFKGVPVVLGYPNFYKVNEAILSQSSNAARFAPDGSEIQLYRTRDGYDTDAQLLDEPARVTTATHAEYETSYSGDIIIEPASGISLDAAVVTMISNYVWQCDPRLDSTCSLMATPYNASDPLCYNFGTGTHMPCSVTNVFTPKVHGGKVMPLVWIRSIAVPSADLVDVLLDASDTRYALSICVIILPVIFLVGMIYGALQIKSIYYSNDYSPGELHKQNSL